MANSHYAKFTIGGLDEIRATLRALPIETQTKVLAVAVKRSAKPLVDAAKALAPSGTGALRQSITAIVKKSRKGGSYAVVGPARGYYKAGAKLGKDAARRGSASPAHYAHLVEFGHQVGTRKTKAARKSKGRASPLASGGKFIAPRAFMRPALLTTQAQIASEMALGIAKGLEQSLARIVKNPAARG
jgi:HK97 gp10 family phage protein